MDDDLFDTSQSGVADRTDNGYTDANVPAYMVAADTHNYANNNDSFLDKAADDLEGAAKFVAVSLASGVNSIYNTAASVDKWAGGDMQQNDLTTSLNNLDDNLGTYYEQHKQAADLVGFIATSFLPGTLGVKVLNAGQKVLRLAADTGMVGANMGKALGLLTPSQPTAISAAIKAITDTNNTFSLISSNTIRGVVAGYAQSTLEAAAFETAVATTMNQSPILQGQDLKDLTSNILWGGLAGGAIGGSIEWAKSLGAIKRGVTAADTEALPHSFINELPDGSSPAENVLNYIDQKNNLPAIDPENARASLFSQMQSSKVDRLDNFMRQNLLQLTGKDSVVTQQLFDSLKNQDTDTAASNLMHLTEVSRAGEVLKTEAAIKAVTKAQAAGTATASDFDSIADAQVRYLRLYGDDDAGVVSDNPPAYLNLADTLKKGEDIKVTQGGVSAGSKVYKFNSDPAKGWDASASTNPLEAEARYIWAINSAPLGEKAIINENDLPLLEKAYHEDTPGVSIKLQDGSTMEGMDKQGLLSFLEQKKMGLANDLVGSTQAVTQGLDNTYKIAKVLNVRPSWLEGTASSNPERDIFAMQSYSQDVTQQMIANGTWSAAKGDVQAYMQPSLLKLGYRVAPVRDLDGNVLDGMSSIMEKRRLYQDAADRTFSGYAKDLSSSFMPIPDEMIHKANRYGAGAGWASFANGQYGSLASTMERVGASTARLIKGKQDAVRDVLDPILHKVANDPEAAIEWSALNAKLRGTPEKYVLNDAGDALVPRSIKSYTDKIAAGEKDLEPPELTDKDAETEIPINSEKVQELVAAHINMNGQRIDSLQQVRANQGYKDLKDPDTFYPIPVDTKAYPHFAFVIDPTVTATGHSRMLYADSESALANLIKSVPPEFKVLTKGDAEDYYKSIGQFDFNHTLHENYIDPALKRSGVSMPYYVPTDPARITQDVMDWHLKSESYLAREMVSHKYSAPFNELYDLGDQFTKMATSKYGSSSIAKYAQDRVSNPYVDYVKTALNVNKANEYPFWMPLNRSLDKAVSNVWDKVSGVWDNSKSPQDLDTINSILKENGIQSAYPDAATVLYANHAAPQGVLSNFVRRANSILSAITLRTDPMHAAHVTLGSAILLGPELKAVLRGIANGDVSAAGDLAKLAKITVPGTQDQILSPVKLISNSISRYFADLRTEGSPLLTYYRKQGLLSNMHDQFRQTLDALTLNGSETSSALDANITRAHALAKSMLAAGEKYTGNKFADEFNTFLAADVMKQLTDVAVKHSLMDEGTALSYMQTFVNRVHGNHLATQRPMMFQGPIGQAIGLFQSYQFNLMQQLFRHVAEGSNKDAAMMMGLQGAVFGAQSLPGFNAINQHIIGTASGNIKHTDMYDAVYGTLPKNAADWLMFGASSNMLLDPDLKINLYTRGDINPRSLTVVPVNPMDVPIVKASTKFFGNLADTAGKIIQGGNVWPALLNGLEHNGVSRPLAGLAQTLEGFTNPNYQSFSTSSKGNIMSSNDLLSLTNLARIAGAKPLDEAVAVDAAYRMNAYAAYDNARIQSLGSTIKTTVQGGNQPTSDQLNNFAYEYAKVGGKQGTFNKFMARTMMQANTSQANIIARHLSNPFGQSMQQLMGGMELKDFGNDGLPMAGTDAGGGDASGGSGDGSGGLSGLL
jgi:hypothetical protein